MAKNNLTDLSTTNDSNTDIGGANVAENCSPGGINNAIRNMAGLLARAFNEADPTTKITAVKAQNFIVAADADKVTLGTTNPTLLQHDNSTTTTTVNAERNLTLEVGTQATPATFRVDGYDSTHGKKTIVQVGTDNGITLGDSTVSPTNAVTVNGRVNATSFVGDGSGLTNLGTQDGAFPVGGIVMWSGTLATIPTGWALCDGTTQNSVVTPDLRAKFVMGASAAVNPGGTGGSSSQTLVEANLPSHAHGAGTIGDSHSHSFSGSNTHDHGDGDLAAGSHSHSISGTSHSHTVSYNSTTIYLPASGTSAQTVITAVGSGGSSAGTSSANGANSSTDNSSASVSGDTSNASISVSGTTGTANLSGTSASAGSGTSFDNRPAFYEIAYIMYVGA